MAGNTQHSVQGDLGGGEREGERERERERERGRESEFVCFFLTTPTQINTSDQVECMIRV